VMGDNEIKIILVFSIFQWGFTQNFPHFRDNFKAWEQYILCRSLFKL